MKLFHADQHRQFMASSFIGLHVQTLEEVLWLVQVFHFDARFWDKAGEFFLPPNRNLFEH